MKILLKILFAAIFLFMAGMTIRTGLEISLWDAWGDYRENPWAMATLYDAYLGFVIFYVWVVYKETRLPARAAWFVLIMGLGNIATSLYVLIQLFRLGPEEPASVVLWKRSS